MTLIAFHAREDEATLLTDTLSYTENFSSLGATTKVQPLLHLDAAFAVKGTSDFSFFAAAAVRSAYEEAKEFDRVTAILEPVLAEACEALPPPTDLWNAGLLALVGYSNEAQSFQGWTFGTHDGFVAEMHDGLFVLPAPPVAYRPHPHEMQRLEALAADERCPPEDHAFLDAWQTAVAMPPPTTPDDWVRLGVAAYRTRALSDARAGIKAGVGGELHLTTLRRGEQRMRRVHTFDVGDLDRLLAWTQHPRSLDRDCFCESGKVFGECCGLEAVEVPTATCLPNE